MGKKIVITGADFSANGFPAPSGATMVASQSVVVNTFTNNKINKLVSFTDVPSLATATRFRITVDDASGYTSGKIGLVCKVGGSYISFGKDYLDTYSTLNATYWSAALEEFAESTLNITMQSVDTYETEEAQNAVLGTTLTLELWTDE